MKFWNNQPTYYTYTTRKKQPSKHWVTYLVKSWGPARSLSKYCTAVLLGVRGVVGSPKLKFLVFKLKAIWILLGRKPTKIRVRKIRVRWKQHLESQLFSIKRPCLPGGVWREFTRDSRTVRCMEAANDYITHSIGVLSKHGRSLKGIRRVEVFEKSIWDAMAVNRRLPLTFELSSCRKFYVQGRYGKPRLSCFGCRFGLVMGVPKKRRKNVWYRKSPFSRLYLSAEPPERKPRVQLTEKAPNPPSFCRKNALFRFGP